MAKTMESKRNNVLLEERIVGFIDILGFRKIVAKMLKEPSYYEEIKTLLEMIILNESLPTNADYDEKLDDPREDPNSQITIFSDSIVFSFTVNEMNFYHAISFSNITFIWLLKQGVLSRGGITFGKTYHKGRLIFGDGLIKAYDLERERAKYPRIIISEEIISSCKNHPYINISRDTDGEYYIKNFSRFTLTDTFFEQDIENFRLIKNRLQFMLSEELNQKIINKRILEKIRWIILEYNEALKECKIAEVKPISIEKVNEVLK